jgi:hypothetical protein
MSLKPEVVFLKVVTVGCLLFDAILAFAATRISENNMVSRSRVGDFRANFDNDSSTCRVSAVHQCG